MSTSENKYEKIIKQLRETEPVLQDKEELTEKIILKIKQEKLQPLKKINVFTLVIRPAMTAAAIFLIGLFLFQQVNYSSQHSKYEFSSNEIKTENSLIGKELGYNKEIANKMDDCFHVGQAKSKSISRICAAKVILMQKSIEIKESQRRRQRLQSWFNH